MGSTHDKVHFLIFIIFKINYIIKFYYFFIVFLFLIFKDGVSAAAVFAEMANWLRSQQEPLTLQQQLFAIYRQYGFHLTKNSYWIVPGPEVTKKLFADLRGNGNASSGEDYPKAMGASGRIQFVRDLTTGFVDFLLFFKSFFDFFLNHLIFYYLIFFWIYYFFNFFLHFEFYKYNFLKLLNNF